MDYISPTGADMRAYRRLRSDLVLKLGRRSVDDEAVTCTAKDVSLGGVFVEVLAPYEVGTEVDLEFALPGTVLKVRAIGRVVWQDPEFGMGVEFTTMTAESRANVQSYIASARRADERGSPHK